MNLRTSVGLGVSLVAAIGLSAIPLDAAGGGGAATEATATGGGLNRGRAASSRAGDGAASGGTGGGAAAPGQVPTPSLLIGNCLVTAPCGIAFVVDNAAAFVVDTGAPYYAGVAAPDDSFHSQELTLGTAKVEFQWGRVGDGVIARLTSDAPVEVPLQLKQSWPGFVTTYTPTPEGATGAAPLPGGRTASWRLRTSPRPVRASGTEVVVAVAPGAPAYFAAGTGLLPDLDHADAVLQAASERYRARRPAASGDWGDFIGAIADNCNNSRIYSSDNHRLAHSVSRGWAGGNPNNDPYFCWDSFFTADLASLDDPATARNTVLAILSCQTAEGLVPNFGHWNYASSRASDDRSQPPVAALCIWKMQQRWPDLAFLREVYPALVKWHRWWPTARDGNHDGLLEWGSSTGVFQNAQFETGWDDNLHFAGAQMSGSTMDADAIDLNSLYTMDAKYLALLAEELGRRSDADALRAEHRDLARRINDRLWNERLGLYCSRLWNGVKREIPAPASAFGGGFDATFYGDETLQQEAGRRHDPAIQFNWNDAPPLPGMSPLHWSARWKGAFTPPTAGQYRFTTSSDDGVRVFVDGKKVIDDWSVHGETKDAADVNLEQGHPVPLVVEYYQHEGGAVLRLAVNELQTTSDPDAAFLTRLTPMNFYPLLAGVPDAARARRVMSVLADPRKFWGDWVLPTLAYDDPDYHQQEYWRGDIWGPVNYLVFQGLEQYASPEQQTDFAKKSAALFMKSWTTKNLCSENYLSTDGAASHDPHYTWGALLNLVALENIVDFDLNGAIRLNGVQSQSLRLDNIPIHGKLYGVQTGKGWASLLRDGKVVLTARNEVVHRMLRG